MDEKTYMGGEPPTSSPPYMWNRYGQPVYRALALVGGRAMSTCAVLSASTERSH